MNNKLINTTQKFFKLLTGKISVSSENINNIFSKNSKIISTYSNDIIERKNLKNHINKIKNDDINYDNIFNSFEKINNETYVNNCYVRWVSKSRPSFKNRITFVYTYYDNIKDYQIDLVHSSKLPFDE